MMFSSLSHAFETSPGMFAPRRWLILANFVCCGLIQIHSKDIFASNIPAFVDPGVQGEDVIDMHHFQAVLTEDPYLLDYVHYFLHTSNHDYFIRQGEEKVRQRYSNEGPVLERVEHGNLKFHTEWINERGFKIVIEGLSCFLGQKTVANQLRRFDFTGRVYTSSAHVNRVQPRLERHCKNAISNYVQDTRSYLAGNGDFFHDVVEHYTRLEGPRDRWKSKGWGQYGYGQDCVMSFIGNHARSCQIHAKTEGCIHEPFRLGHAFSDDFISCERVGTYSEDGTSSKHFAWRCTSLSNYQYPVEKNILARVDFLLGDIENTKPKASFDVREKHIINSGVFFQQFRQFHSFHEIIAVSSYVAPESVDVLGKSVGIASEIVSFIENASSERYNRRFPMVPHLRLHIRWSKDSNCWPSGLVNANLGIMANNVFVGKVLPGDQYYYFPLIDSSGQVAWDSTFHDDHLELSTSARLVDRSDLLIDEYLKIPGNCILSVSDAAIVFLKEDVEREIFQTTTIARHVLSESMTSFDTPLALLKLVNSFENIVLQIFGGHQVFEQIEEDSCRQDELTKDLSDVVMIGNEKTLNEFKDGVISELNGNRRTTIQVEDFYHLHTNLIIYSQSRIVRSIAQFGMFKDLQVLLQSTHSHLDDFAKLQIRRIALEYMLNSQLEFKRSSKKGEDMFATDDWLFVESRRKS